MNVAQLKRALWGDDGNYKLVNTKWQEDSQWGSELFVRILLAGPKVFSTEPLEEIFVIVNFKTLFFNEYFSFSWVGTGEGWGQKFLLKGQ